MLNLVIVLLIPLALGVLVFMLAKPLYALYLGIFTSGILISTNFPLVGNKLAFPDLPLAILLIGTILGLVSGRLSKEINSLGLKLSLVGGGLFLVAALFSFAVNIGRFPDYVSSGFVAILNYTYGFGICLSVIFVVREWKEWYQCIVCWIAGAFVVSLVGIWALFWDAPKWAYDGIRVSSTLRTVNQMQSYVAPAMLLSLWFGTSKMFRFRIQIVAILFAFAAAFSLLGTGSRSAIFFIVLVISLTGFSILYQPTMRSWATNFLMLVIVITTVGGMFLGYKVWKDGGDLLGRVDTAVTRPFTKFQEMVEGDGIEQVLGPRGEQINIIMENLHRWPVFGVGPANFKNVLGSRHEVHNTYLGLLVEQGLVGVALYLVLVTSAVFAIWFACRNSKIDTLNYALMGFFLAFLLILIYGLVTFGIRQRIFWIVLGLTLAAVRIIGNQGYTSYIYRKKSRAEKRFE